MLKPIKYFSKTKLILLKYCLGIYYGHLQCIAGNLHLCHTTDWHHISPKTWILFLLPLYLCWPVTSIGY